MVRELDGEMQEIKEICKGIPEAERIAPKQAKEGSFDLTSANAFMANPQWADNIFFFWAWRSPAEDNALKRPDHGHSKRSWRAEVHRRTAAGIYRLT